MEIMLKSISLFFAPFYHHDIKKVLENLFIGILNYSKKTCILGVRKKVDRSSLKNFLGDNNTKFIEILHAVTIGYYQHFYIVSKRSVAIFLSIVKFKTTSQKMQYLTDAMA